MHQRYSHTNPTKPREEVPQTRHLQSVRTAQQTENGYLLAFAEAWQLPYPPPAKPAPLIGVLFDFREKVVRGRHTKRTRTLWKVTTPVHIATSLVDAIGVGVATIKPIRNRRHCNLLGLFQQAIGKLAAVAKLCQQSNLKRSAIKMKTPEHGRVFGRNLCKRRYQFT